jgi:hypothetical protein
MALLAVTDIGEALAWVSADAGADGYDLFPNDGRCAVLVNNGGGTEETFKLIGQDAVNCPAEEVHDSDDVVMPAGATGVLEPALASRPQFNDRTTGQSRIEYSDETNLLVAVHRMI